jgi:Zn-dependent protease
MGFTSGFRIGRVLGIPLFISPSWFLILGLIIVVLNGQFAHLFPAWSDTETWLIAIMAGLLFFGSVVLHELCHSLVALRKGLPVRGITLFLLGGVSQIGREAPRPGAELLIALVGPLCSLVLGGALIALAVLLDGVTAYASGLCAVLGQANLGLGIFNLAPAFPLDGGRVLRAALWAATRSRTRATRIAGRTSQVLAVALALAGLATGYFITPVSGVWLMLVGWFVFTAATSSLRQQRLETTLGTLQVRDIMSTGLPVLQQTDTVQAAVATLLAPSSAPCVLVARKDMEMGVVTPQSVRSVPRPAWGSTQLGAVAQHASQFKTLLAGAPASDTIQAMDDSAITLVIDNEGYVVGAVTRESIAGRLQAMRSLGVIAR